MCIQLSGRPVFLETHLVRAILIEKMTVLPRQARDKHR
eukprot:COSAG06_NODE_72563_length_169_cov_15.900000_1_plen_37_part_01